VNAEVCESVDWFIKDHDELLSAYGLRRLAVVQQADGHFSWEFTPGCVFEAWMDQGGEQQPVFSYVAEDWEAVKMVSAMAVEHGPIKPYTKAPPVISRRDGWRRQMKNKGKRMRAKGKRRKRR